MPFFRRAQLHCFLTPGIYLGATNIILAGPNPASILPPIEKERVTKPSVPQPCGSRCCATPTSPPDLSSLLRATMGPR